MRKFLMCCAIFFCALLLVGYAQADLWDYPDEISVAEVYNSFYGTTYNETDTDGLDDLLTDHEGSMVQTWNTNFLKTIDVMVFDTSSTNSITLRTSSNANYLIFDPGPWTPPSRGEIVMETIDLVATLGGNVDFSLYVGSTVLNSFNTLMIMGEDFSTTDTFFLAYNQGGWSGDADFNEPLLVANATPVPEPATLILLGTGLVGLAGFSRKKIKN